MENGEQDNRQNNRHKLQRRKIVLIPKQETIQSQCRLTQPEARPHIYQQRRHYERNQEGLHLLSRMQDHLSCLEEERAEKKDEEEEDENLDRETYHQNIVWRGRVFII